MKSKKHPARGHVCACVCVCVCVCVSDCCSIRSVLSGLGDRESCSPARVTAQPWGWIEVCQCQWRLRRMGPKWQAQTASFGTRLEIISPINPLHEGGWGSPAGLSGYLCIYTFFSLCFSIMYIYFTYCTYIHTYYKLDTS